MKRIVQWIVPFRPAACILGFFISFASWAIAYHHVNAVAFWTSLECFWFLANIMVVNNWFDRYHDAYEKRPRNDFALKNEKAYLRYMLACLALEAIFIGLLCHADWRFALLATIRMLGGFFYSWARKVFALSAAVTAGISALCAVTPAAIGGANCYMWKFLVATTCAIFAWECLKDIQDFPGDSADGYKRTIAAVKGPNIARLVARYSMVFAGLIFLAMPLTILPAPAAWGGVVCLSTISAAAYIVFNAQKAKRLMGAGMAVFLVLLNSSYWLLMTMEPVRSLALSPVCYLFGFAALILLTLGKPKLVSELVIRALDDGTEKLERIHQGPLLWPLMYLLYCIVIFICRAVCSNDLHETFTTAVTATGILCLLVVAKPAHVHVPGRSHGYTVIERHSLGLVIGFFFTAYDILGLSITAIAFFLPLATIIEPDLEPLCRLLRSYGCWWGIMVGVAIVKGIVFSLTSILPAYFAIVAAYFLWRRYHKIPVYKPKLLADWMTNLGFVGEEIPA